MIHNVEFSKIIPCDSSYLYNWHNMPKALERLIPYWEKVNIKTHPEFLADDAPVELNLKLGPLSLPWNLRIHDVILGKQFKDSQLSGPFKSWTHLHEMQPINDQHALLVENIAFELIINDPFFSKSYTMKKLKRLFNFRLQVISNDIQKHYKYKDKATMKILITGASGLVGDALVKFLSSGGHQVFKLIRDDITENNQIYWHPSESASNDGFVDIAALEGFDAVIHLAGENIANGRWTKEQKQKIYDSRVSGTKFLVDQLLKLHNPPKIFISASATGFYAHDEIKSFNEDSEVGSGFLADTCLAWEKESKRAEEKGIRVVNTRFGIILDPKAGALAKMLPLFSLGGGGILGTGKQWMSWVALDDVIGAIHHSLMNDNISGAVNVVSPEPVTNAEFTKTLAKVLNRPAVFPAPAFALRLVLGEMADALLLSSTKVEPKVLKDTNYEFSFPGLESALRHMLGK
jgi:uncharacterized protein